MKKRLAGMFLLAITLVFVCAVCAQADFVQIQGNTYYQTESGTYLTGLQEINGERYYFDASGILQKKAWVKTPDGKVYRASKTGKLLRNQWYKKKYYLNDASERAAGLVKIGTKLYYFSAINGKLQTGMLKDEQGNLYITNKKGVVYSGRLFKYKKSRYYAGEDGKLAKGLAKVGLNYYYFKPSNGKMITDKKKKVDGYYYYFSVTGEAACNQWVRIKKKYYYFQQDGRMATCMYIGKKWYVGEDGVRIKAANAPKAGVNEKDGKYYLYDSSYHLIVSQWTKVDDKTYYAGTDGAALTGLQTIGSDQYYFDKEGVLQTDTVVVIGGKTYKLAEDGRVTQTTEAMGSAIAEFAQKYVGNPYVYGGTSLTKGADCSGFCYTVFAKFGIKLMRVADDQMKGPSDAYQKLGFKKGTVVMDKDLAPGDLIFYGSSKYAHHVAIYIGDGKVVHAANSRLGIIVSDMNYSGVRVVNGAMRYWL